MCALPIAGASRGGAQAQEMWFTGLVVPRHMGSFLSRDQTRVCYRLILYHWSPGKPASLSLRVGLVISYAWNPAIGGPSFSSHDVSKIRLCWSMRQYPAPFYRWITPCFV